MSEQTKNIRWMAEELDFAIAGSDQRLAEQLVQEFLEDTTSPNLAHSVYPA